MKNLLESIPPVCSLGHTEVPTIALEKNGQSQHELSSNYMFMEPLDYNSSTLFRFALASAIFSSVFLIWISLNGTLYSKVLKYIDSRIRTFLRTPLLLSVTFSVSHTDPHWSGLQTRTHPRPPSSHVPYSKSVVIQCLFTRLSQSTRDHKGTMAVSQSLISVLCTVYDKGAVQKSPQVR